MIRIPAFDQNMASVSVKKREISVLGPIYMRNSVIELPVETVDVAPGGKEGRCQETRSLKYVHVGKSL